MKGVKGEKAEAAISMMRGISLRCIFNERIILMAHYAALGALEERHYRRRFIKLMMQSKQNKCNLCIMFNSRYILRSS